MRARTCSGIDLSDPPNLTKSSSYLHPGLKADSGTVAYRYPLGTGRNVWNRPHPSVEVSRPGAVQKFGTVSGKIEIAGKQPLRNIYSPSHSIDTKRASEGKARITFETQNNDNDFQLFYGLSDDDFGMSLITHREPGKDGYFMLLLSPKDDVTERELVNKDIVLSWIQAARWLTKGRWTRLGPQCYSGFERCADGEGSTS